MTVRSAVLAAVFLALQAGCGSSDGDRPRAETPESSAPASTVPPSAVPSSVVPSSGALSSDEASPAAESTGPPPTAGRVHHLGDRVRLVSGSRMTVFSWERVRRPGGPAAGAWWAADVEFCLTRTFGAHFEEPIGNIRSQLLVELSDERALTAEADARKSDEVYAQPIPVVAGRCRRGKLVFDVPAGGRASYLAATYSPFEWVRWQLS